jgi:hypothetical protein
LVKDIRERVQKASEKVRERVESRFIPKIIQTKNDPMPYLDDIEMNIMTLAEDPNDPCGGGHYQGWTTDEIKELYSVLYGEEI